MKELKPGDVIPGRETGIALAKAAGLDPEKTHQDWRAESYGQDKVLVEFRTLVLFDLAEFNEALTAAGAPEAVSFANPMETQDGALPPTYGEAQEQGGTYLDRLNATGLPAVLPEDGGDFPCCAPGSDYHQEPPC